MVLLKDNEVKIVDTDCQEVYRDVFHVDWDWPEDKKETVEETEITNREHHCILPVL